MPGQSDPVLMYVVSVVPPDIETTITSMQTIHPHLQASGEPVPRGLAKADERDSTPGTGGGGEEEAEGEGVRDQSYTPAQVF